MKRRIVAIALIVATTACSSMNRQVAVRPLNGEAGAAAQDALARGDLLFGRGEHALALDAYRRAMRKDPGDAHALNGVAISYAAIGRHDLAREFFELALARAPQDQRIYRNFARSLTAQGLRGEADALLAQMSGGAPRVANRPTLAQLSSVRAPAAATVRVANGGLERISMGEVRLRTTTSTLPGRMTPQLSAAIVTVAEDGGSTPVVSLSRELTAPIARLSRQAVATPAVATAARAKPIVAVANDADGCAVAKGMRLRATGYTIDLITSRADADAARKCPSLAGGEDNDARFERLSARSGGRG